MKRFWAVQLTVAGLVLTSMAYRPAAAAPEAPTFTKDVAPIFYKSCVSCHRPGEIAPMSLISYEDARPWARAIKRRVAAREMPPWFADPQQSLRFRNDNSLTQKEVDTLVAWVDGGSIKGNDADLPKAPTYAAGWSHPDGRPPDYVLSMPKAFPVPAEGEMPGSISFYVKSPFPDDVYLESAEMRPGNRAIVHHAGAYTRTLPADTQFDEYGRIVRTAAQNGAQRSAQLAAAEDRDIAFGVARLVSFSPGRGFENYRPGSGKRLPTGKYVELQIHYQVDGRPESDKTELGLWFQKVPMTHEVVQIGVYDTQLVEGKELVAAASRTSKPPLPNIPPYAGNWAITGIWPVKEDAHLLSIEPHMHFRGKDLWYTVVYPDGREQSLLKMPKFESVWQIVHELETPLALPAGSKVVAYGHYDNSPNNRLNPAPDQEVYWSEQSWDEMYHPYIEVTYDARDLTKRSTTQQQ